MIPYAFFSPPPRGLGFTFGRRRGLVLAELLPQAWGGETAALFAAAVSFWFGPGRWRRRSRGAEPMRHVTDAGLALIKSASRASARIYTCSAGYETIGYGHVVLDGERGAVRQ